MFRMVNIELWLREIGKMPKRIEPGPEFMGSTPATPTKNK